MADRDDAMDVGAIEDDALNDDDEENDNGDEVEEGYNGCHDLGVPRCCGAFTPSTPSSGETVDGEVRDAPRRPRCRATSTSATSTGPKSPQE